MGADELDGGDGMAVLHKGEGACIVTTLDIARERLEVEFLLDLSGEAEYLCRLRGVLGGDVDGFIGPVGVGGALRAAGHPLQSCSR